MIVMVVFSWYILVGIFTVVILNRWQSYMNGYSRIGFNAWPMAFIWPLIWLLAVGIGGLVGLLHLRSGYINVRKRYSRFHAGWGSAR